jgi:transcriptional regulator CtsR
MPRRFKPKFGQVPDEMRPLMQVVSIGELRSCRLSPLLMKSHYVAVHMDPGTLMEIRAYQLRDIVREAHSRPSQSNVVENDTDFGQFCVFHDIHDRETDSGGGGYIVFGPIELDGEIVVIDKLLQMIHFVQRNIVQHRLLSSLR